VTGVEGPEQFLWRVRLWKVRAVLAHWVETAPWWQSSGCGGHRLGRAAAAGAPGARGPTCWSSASCGASRPAAARTPVADGGGVFDLSFDWSDGCWQLVGCED
jgi:hypothetical protein